MGADIILIYGSLGQIKKLNEHNVMALQSDKVRSQVRWSSSPRNRPLVVRTVIIVRGSRIKEYWLLG